MKPYGNQFIAELIHCSKNILNDKMVLEQILKLGIKKCNIGLKSISSYQFKPIGVTVIAIVSESHIAIHTYPEARHVSVDIFTCSSDPTKSQELLHFLKNSFKPKTSRIIKILRGNPIEIKEKNWITSFSGYGFETRYHVKKSLLSKKSAYQQIDIIENDNFGRMLFLDNDLQIAEKDANIYHSNVVSPLTKIKKKLNKVAILGGGDGGILNEILKYKPKSVVLVDIDKKIIEAAKKYLRCICNDAFNQPNVKVIIDDVNNFLEKNQGFDVIIYDLTMHPASITNIDRKTFLNEVFLGIKNSLNKKGMISLQCCPEFDIETFNILKKILLKYFSEIAFKKSFVPSFCENLIFATARSKEHGARSMEHGV